ncbi:MULTISPECIES: PepSY domain-containing protein [Sporosarcina]|uniref:PepSY domain-containing protein n=1 Tax=Sporosarcina contaminans TaxID=633403 RepID=A0ABW3U2A1_9BACL
MKLKDFLAGALTGIAAAIIVNQAIEKVNPNTPAEDVLKAVKEAFKKEGPIDGSWIVMKPEPFTNNVLSMEVYRGGISRIKNGELEQYEFAANAETGTVVELIKK